MRFLTTIIILALLSGCAAKKTIQQNNPSMVEFGEGKRAEIDLGTQRTSQTMHDYLLGELSLQDQKLPEALKHFENANSQMQSPPAELQMKIAELSLKTGNLEQALKETKALLDKDPENPEILLMYGGVLEALNRYEEADPIYRKVIENRPDDVNSYLLLASLSLRRGELDDSISTLKKLIQKVPENPIGFYNLGRAYEAKGDLSLSERELRKAFEMVSEKGTVGLDLVRVLIKQQKREEARDLCSAILEKDPYNTSIRKVIGNIHLGDSNYDEALKHLEVLEKEEKDPTDTRLKIALIHIERQNFVEAEKELNLILAKEPKSGIARYYLGSVQASTGKKKLAVETLVSVPKEEEMYVPSRLLAALILRQDKDFKKAIEVVKKALDANPDNLDIMAYYAALLRERKQYVEAERAISEMNERLPNNDKILFELAAVKFELKKNEEAEVLINKVLAINPKHSEALNFLAFSYAEREHNLDQAMEMIEEALNGRPEDGYLLDTKGWIEFKQKKYSQAVATLAVAVEKVNNDAEIMFHYAEALRMVNDKKTAKTIYQRVLDQLRIDREDGKTIRLEEQKIQDVIQKISE